MSMSRCSVRTRRAEMCIGSKSNAVDQGLFRPALRALAEEEQSCGEPRASTGEPTTTFHEQAKARERRGGDRRLYGACGLTPDLFLTCQRGTSAGRAGARPIPCRYDAAMANTEDFYASVAQMARAVEPPDRCGHPCRRAALDFLAPAPRIEIAEAPKSYRSSGCRGTKP
jgi:hypothetical protein